MSNSLSGLGHGGQYHWPLRERQGLLFLAYGADCAVKIVSGGQVRVAEECIFTACLVGLCFCQGSGTS